MDVASDRAQAIDRGARYGQQMMVHPLEMLADDMEPRIGHQMMDVGNTAGNRVLDRDHRKPRAAFAHRSKGVLKLGARERDKIGKDAAAGEIGIGSEGALK